MDRKNAVCCFIGWYFLAVIAASFFLCSIFVQYPPGLCTYSSSQCRRSSSCGRGRQNTTTMQRVRTSGTQRVNVWLVRQSLAVLRCSSRAGLVVVETQGHDGLAFPAPQRTQPPPGWYHLAARRLQFRA